MREYLYVLVNGAWWKLEAIGRKKVIISRESRMVMIHKGLVEGYRSRIL